MEIGEGEKGNKGEQSCGWFWNHAAQSTSLGGCPNPRPHLQRAGALWAETWFVPLCLYFPYFCSCLAQVEGRGLGVVFIPAFLLGRSDTWWMCGVRGVQPVWVSQGELLLKCLFTTCVLILLMLFTATNSVPCVVEISHIWTNYPREEGDFIGFRQIILFLL